MSSHILIEMNNPETDLVSDFLFIHTHFSKTYADYYR